MASFIRGKQAGMQNDLSAGILPNLFAPEVRIRYGIASQISCLAYDPVQSLLAVGTTQSRFGRGTIYVFGQGRVHRIIEPRGGSSLRQLQFTAGRLVSLDAKSELAMWDMDTGERVAGTVSAGPAAIMVTDPMLDWAFLGLSNGEVVAFDLEGERLSPLRIPNLWRARQTAEQQRGPRPPAVTMTGLGLVSMQLHPRDPGQLLIGYAPGAAIYSFKENCAVKYFEYVVPPGAPGGNGETPNVTRRPRLTHALWHPTGTFVLTAHDDGSLVFWDPRDGRVVLARSLYDTAVDKPVDNPAHLGSPRLLDPFTKIAWCCKKNPDDTALLIAGGLAFDAPEKGLTFLELGPTPVYATSSWQVLSDHFKGRRQQLLPIPPGTEVATFCPAPRLSPHFDGACDPLAIFTLLGSGELLTLSFPSGYPISPTNQLHVSLSFVSPFVVQFAMTTMGRERWLGLTEKRNLGEPLLKGGAEGSRPRRRYEGRSIIQTAHADGTVRVWDIGHGDDIENGAVLQVDVARALARDRNVDISALSMGAATGELAVGTRAGEVLLFRWGNNKTFGQAPAATLPQEGPANPGGFVDISSRTEETLQDGLQPWVMYEMLQGPVTVVGAADVGFVAAGSENGYLSIIDLRGPTIIYHGALGELAKPDKRSSFLGGRHNSNAAAAQKDFAVVVEFAVLTLDGKTYSSLVCLVGTELGKVLTFELLPSGSGYTAKFSGMVDLKDRIVAICPIVADTGAPATATGAAVAGLRNGLQVHGTLVVVTKTEVRIFKPAAAKGASKSFDDVFCYSAQVVHMELHGYALVGVFGDNATRAFTLPGLKEINQASLAALDASRSGEAIVMRNGDILGWTGPSELIVVSAWGGGRGKAELEDKLVNPDLAIPPRPTISNLQWISGTQYVSPTDLDLLIGGPDRPPSKRMMAAAAEEDRLARHGGGPGGPGGPGAGPASPRQISATARNTEGWGQYLTRQFNERTEKLNFLSESMDNLEEQSQGWADDVSRYVAHQKRGMVMGAVKSKFI